jgi:hypothetical protein
MKDCENGSDNPETAPLITIPDGSLQQRPLWWGIILGFALHLLQILTWVAAGIVGEGGWRSTVTGALFMSPFFIGVTQFVYIAPAIIASRRNGQYALAQGLIIASAITILVNSSCWGWFAITKPRIGG